MPFSVNCCEVSTYTSRSVSNDFDETSNKKIETGLNKLFQSDVYKSGLNEHINV